MARTKGSGWGGGVLLYQYHLGFENCGTRKVIYDPIPWSDLPPYRCLYCKKRFWDSKLINKKYK